VTRVWFVVPAHGRVGVARVCLRQLARTCEDLRGEQIDATAVVIADDENLDTARGLGFAVVHRENKPLGRKWNDGYQLATDPLYNHRPADFVIPFGSDDWIDPELVVRQVQSHGAELRCSRLSCVVNENATRLRRLHVAYEGRLDFGDGVRVIPSWLIAPLGYRPAEEDARRAIDTSVFRRIERILNRPPRVMFTELHPFQVVDWKTHDDQLNPYAACAQRFGDGDELDPFEALAPHYPAEALDEMAALHAGLVAA
jgi:glycosyltransferase involved in cell wall biosynthesis